MADIVIFGLTVTGNESGDNLYISGQARLSGQAQYDNNVSWGCVVSPSASVLTMNTAMKNAAVDAAYDQLAVTVGALDSKIILGGGALGL